MATDTDDTAVDSKLFGVIGLYRVLSPPENGGISKRTRSALISLVLMVNGYFAIQIGWLKFSDIQFSMYFLVVIMNGIACGTKSYAMMRHGVRLGAVLETCRFSFTACVARRPTKMRRCRDTLSWLLRRLNVLYLTTCFLWLITPLMLPTYINVPLADGTTGRYRCTVYCLWFPLPERVHSCMPGWTAFLLVEVIAFCVGAVGMILFDTTLLTICSVMNAQFRTLSAGCESLGRCPRKQQSENRPDVSGNNQNELIQIDHYNDLISHIKDTQKLMNKLKDFYDVIQPFIIFQMAIGSFSVLSFIFLVSTEFFSGHSLMTTLFLKYVISLTSFTIQLYLYCYVFDHIEIAKSTINFGLYSCNWTEMDLKFQKTMLLAMSINSAYSKKMKVTPRYVINREFFYGVLKTSFSIIPVLLELSKNQRKSLN